MLKRKKIRGGVGFGGLISKFWDITIFVIRILLIKSKIFSI